MVLQVQRTCEALDQQGFTDITTLELLLRVYEVTTETFSTDAAAAPQPNRSGKKRGWQASAATDAAAADAAAAGSQQQQQQQYQQVMTKPVMDARGHTGYLTFAFKFVPAVPLAGQDEQEEQEESSEGDEEDEQQGEEGQ
jgi:tRNA (adenine57-N1/adenine58-N1)-methyltransferase